MAGRVDGAGEAHPRPRHERVGRRRRLLEREALGQHPHPEVLLDPAQTLHHLRIGGGHPLPGLLEQPREHGGGVVLRAEVPADHEARRIARALRPRRAGEKIPVAGHNLPERHPGPGQLLACCPHPRDRIAHGPGPLESRRRLEPRQLLGAEQSAGDLEPERNRFDDPVALELEVDVGELAVDVHADRHAPCQQRAERRPRLLQSRRELHVPGGQAELVPCPEQVAGGVHDGGDLVPIVGDHRDLHWPRPPPVPGRADRQHRQVRLAERLGPGRPAREIPPHPLIGLQVPRQHLAPQHQPLEARAPRQRHVQLAVGEGAAGEVHDHPVQGLPLRLVDRDRPGQLHRQLRERADHLMHQRTALDAGARDLPGVLAHLLGAAVAQQHGDHRPVGVGADRRDPAERAVDPAIERVVVQQHHLRAHRDPQRLLGGLLESVGVPAGLRGEGLHRRGQTLEHLPVPCADDPVGRGERQPELVQPGLEVGVRPTVQLAPRLLEQRPFPHRVQQVHELVIALLAEHGRQLHHREGVLVEGAGGEEERRAVALLDPRRLAVGHHRRQLVQVADEHELHPAEGGAGPRAVLLERGGERIEEVRPHHRRLVDDQRVQLLQRLREASRVVGAAAHVLLGDAEREGEQAVDRVPVHVQRRDPSGCDGDRGAVGLLEIVPDQRRLAGAGLAGEEQVVAGVEVLEGGGELVGDHQRGRGRLSGRGGRRLGRRRGGLGPGRRSGGRRRRDI